jgi:hypothetical protein
MLLDKIVQIEARRACLVVRMRSIRIGFREELSQTVKCFSRHDLDFVRRFDNARPSPGPFGRVIALSIHRAGEADNPGGVVHRSIDTDPRISIELIEIFDQALDQVGRILVVGKVNGVQQIRSVARIH